MSQEYKKNVSLLQKCTFLIPDSSQLSDWNPSHSESQTLKRCSELKFLLSAVAIPFSVPHPGCSVWGAFGKPQGTVGRYMKLS